MIILVIMAMITVGLYVFSQHVINNATRVHQEVSAEQLADLIIKEARRRVEEGKK